MLREQPPDSKRIRNQKQRRNAYHAPMSQDVYDSLEETIVERTLTLICAGNTVDMNALAHEGARERLTVMLEPFCFAGILLQRVLRQQEINIPFIRSHYSEAYDLWVTKYLTQNDKILLGIETCDEAALRAACREMTQRRKEALGGTFTNA